MLGRRLKAASLALILSGASLGYGMVCRRLALVHLLFSPPFRELRQLLLMLLAALLLMAVVGGLVTVLLRSLSAVSLAFGLSALALLGGCGLHWHTAGLSLLYVLAGLACALLTQDQLEQRLRFSVQPVAGNWRWVTVVLLLLAVASFYFGFAEHVRDSGLIVPTKAVNDLAGDVAAEIVDGTPLSQFAALRREAIEQVQRVLVGRLGNLINRIERYVPPLAAVIVFVLLSVVTWLLWWVPMPILHVLFALLLALHVAEVATETVEAKRLVLT